MTTRSGLTYNAIQGDSGEMSQQSSSVSVGDLLKILGGQPAATGRGGGASEGGGG